MAGGRSCWSNRVCAVIHSGAAPCSRLGRPCRFEEQGASLLVVGDGCAQDHHDGAGQDEAGRRLTASRLPD